MTLTLLLDDKIDFKVECCSSIKINCLSAPSSLPSPSQKAIHDSPSITRDESKKIESELRKLGYLK